MTRRRVPFTILALGDSLTAGLYASRADRGWWPLTTAALAARPAVTVIATVAAAAGGTITDLTATAPTWPATGADVVLVQVGENDVALDDATYRANYDALLAAIHAWDAAALLVCLGPWKGSTGKVAQTQASCLAQGGRYVDLTAASAHPALSGPAGVASWATPDVTDDFHPNDRGHDAIAAAVLQTLGAATTMQRRAAARNAATRPAGAVTRPRVIPPAPGWLSDRRRLAPAGRVRGGAVVWEEGS